MHLLHGLDWTTVSWQHSQQTEAPGVSRQTWRADFSASDMWHVYHIQWMKANCKHIAEVFYKISTSPQGGNTKLLRTRLGSVRFAVLTSLNIQGSLRGGPGKTKTGKSNSVTTAEPAFMNSPNPREWIQGAAAVNVWQLIWNVNS